MKQVLMWAGWAQERSCVPQTSWWAQAANHCSLLTRRTGGELSSYLTVSKTRLAAGWNGPNPPQSGVSRHYYILRSMYVRGRRAVGAEAGLSGFHPDGMNSVHGSWVLNGTPAVPVPRAKSSGGFWPACSPPFLSRQAVELSCFLPLPRPSSSACLIEACAFEISLNSIPRRPPHNSRHEVDKSGCRPCVRFPPILFPYPPRFSEISAHRRPRATRH